MVYREERDQSRPYKEEYLAGFDRIIQQRQTECLALRKEYTKDIFRDPERCRTELESLIGWPLCRPRKGVPSVRLTHLS